MTPASSSAALAAWFDAQADGDWEHNNELRIVSLDNPGWSILIPLTGTELESAPFDPIDDERGTTDWLRCWRTDAAWQAACGALNLDEAISAFIEWATVASA